MLAYPAATFDWLTSGAAGTGGASRQGAQSCLVNYLTGKPRCAESGFNARAIVFKPLGGLCYFRLWDAELHLAGGTGRRWP